MITTDTAKSANLPSPALVRWLTERAWLSDERPEVLFELAAARLRHERVLLPGHTTLERLVVAAQARMESRLLRRLAAVPTPVEGERLESLVRARGDAGRSPLGELRHGPQQVSADSLRDAVERLAAACAALLDDDVEDVAGKSADAAPNSRYFGLGRGVTYYNFVSDQHTGFHAIVVTGTLRDSLFVLDGLLEQRTRLEPDELCPAQ